MIEESAEPSPVTSRLRVFGARSARGGPDRTSRGLS